MSLKFPVSLVGKRGEPIYTPPATTIAYDSGGGIVINSSIVNIPNNWQNGNLNLYGLDLGSPVITIGLRAFYGCYNLTGDLYIPDGVTFVDDLAFYNCRFINARLPDNLTSMTGILKQNAFLESVNIPTSVVTIGLASFQNCPKLAGTITIPPTCNTIGDNAFRNVGGTGEGLTFNLNRLTPPSLGSDWARDCITVDNKIHVPSNATGYAASYWGNTVVKDLPAL